MDAQYFHSLPFTRPFMDLQFEEARFRDYEALAKADQTGSSGNTMQASFQEAKGSVIDKADSKSTSTIVSKSGESKEELVPPVWLERLCWARSQFSARAGSWIGQESSIWKQVLAC